MEISKLTNWAKEIRAEIKEKKGNYNPKYLSKIEAYADMIIARGDILTANAIKGQRYMEEIQDGLIKLHDYGVKVPGQASQTKVTENPLRP